MVILVNKIQFIIIQLICLFLSFQANAKNDLCRDTGITVGFFNGVNTSPSAVNRALEALEKFTRIRSIQDEPINFEVLYNPTNGLEDFVETFDQRLKEQNKILANRFELFFSAQRGNGPWWSSIINVLSSTDNILTDIFNDFTAFSIKQLTSIIANPPTALVYKEHQLKIDKWILNGQKMLFIAHSQGNLFANVAYKYVINKVSSDSVKVIHIAPASPTLNGEYTLADLDLVINGLRLVGSVPNITSHIPNPLSRPAGLNGNKDILGHGLTEIYINPKLDISNRIKEQIDDALNNLVSPERKVSPGFFTAQLEWDGYGDADLYIIEPDGNRVYYSNKNGKSGHLDMDNRIEKGPEHYYASCNSDEIQTGTYQILVDNYSGANGRLATVLIDSNSNGALGTKQVRLGDSTWGEPQYHLFNIIVNKNKKTGRYSAKIS